MNWYLFIFVMVLFLGLVGGHALAEEKYLTATLCVCSYILLVLYTCYIM